VARSVIAADFGGTHLRAALVDEAGAVRLRREYPTPAGTDGTVAIAEIVALLASVAGDAPEPPAAASIATAGLVDADAGTVIIASNIPSFRNLQITGPVAAALGMPGFIENDASAAALGEFRFGAGRGLRHLLHASLGTGIGGGLVIDGRLYRGAKGLAGEIGHVIIQPSGPQCHCGSRGCLEALVSGVAFAARARRLLATGKSSKLAEITAGRQPSGHDLFAAAVSGDAAAEAEVRNGGHFLGLGIGNLVTVLNPDAVTLSGGLLGMGEMLLAPMRETLKSMTYGPAAGTPIRLSELGDDTGLLGAAAVAFERLAERGGGRIEKGGA